MFGDHTSIQLYKARKADLDNQRIKNSESVNLRQKHSSNNIIQIHKKYDAEQQLVRNEMHNIDDKTNNEYLELLAELQEIQDMDDRETTTEETAAQDYESKMDLQNSTIEADIQAIDADIEGFEEMRKDSIEKNFGYFKV